MAFDELSTLLGSYYHEDFEGIWPTLDLYLGDATVDEAVQLAHDVDRFLASTPAGDVPSETWRLGSCLWLGDTPEPYVDWLKEIRRRARRAGMGQGLDEA